MEIKRNGSQASGKGPAEYFTGSVRIDPLMSPPEPSRVTMALVTFEPGARTAWHTHPFGQTLIVTAGAGWVQREGDTRQNVYQGRSLLLPERKTLAWRYRYYRHEPYRYPGKIGWFTC
ncbi:MAG: Cupin domain protein [Mucilaginibacter sp.]|nr:Cupin domain protein [Mucilaginibacter sp.]